MYLFNSWNDVCGIKFEIINYINFIVGLCSKDYDLNPWTTVIQVIKEVMKWKKFIYPTSTRALIDGKRHYDVGTNEKLPSVTTILSATQSEEKKRV